MTNQLTPDNAFVKIKMISKVDSNLTIAPILKDQEVQYKSMTFIGNQQNNQDVWTNMIMADSYKLQSGQAFAEISMAPLLDYPNHQHRLDVYCKKKDPKDRRQQKYSMLVQFAQLRGYSGDKYVELFFKSAELKHNTEAIGKMSPYIKLKNQATSFSWKSDQVKKGGNTPTFAASAKVPFKSLQDSIQVQIWDDDLIKDDLIASATLDVYSLIGNYNQEMIKQLSYTSKKKIHYGGSLFYIVQSGPQII